MASKAKIIKKEIVKNRIYKFFNNKNNATRKELTEYMGDLWKGEAERKKLNNMIGKILNEETRSNKFTKERGDKNQLVFTLISGGLEAELEEEIEEEDEEDEDEDEADEIEDEDEDEEEEEEEVDEAMAQYEEETGKSAITAAGTIRKDFLKWKINN